MKTLNWLIFITLVLLSSCKSNPVAEIQTNKEFSWQTIKSCPTYVKDISVSFETDTVILSWRVEKLKFDGGIELGNFYIRTSVDTSKTVYQTVGIVSALYDSTILKYSYPFKGNEVANKYIRVDVKESDSSILDFFEIKIFYK